MQKGGRDHDGDADDAGAAGAPGSPRSAGAKREPGRADHRQAHQYHRLIGSAVSTSPGPEKGRGIFFRPARPRGAAHRRAENDCEASAGQAWETLDRESGRFCAPLVPPAGRCRNMTLRLAAASGRWRYALSPPQRRDPRHFSLAGSRPWGDRPARDRRPPTAGDLPIGASCPAWKPASRCQAFPHAPLRGRDRPGIRPGSAGRSGIDSETRAGVDVCRVVESSLCCTSQAMPEAQHDRQGWLPAVGFPYIMDSPGALSD